MDRKIIVLLILILIVSFPVFAEDANLKKMHDSLARGYLAARKNDIDAAYDYFTKSLEFANRAKSWKGFVDAGNAFSALGKPKRALSPLKHAYNIAAAKRDWRGLVAVSYAYASLPENLRVKKNALSALNMACKIASSKKDWRGLKEAANAYHKLGEERKAKDIFVSVKKIITNPNLPSGWKPYGESVAGPKKISSDAQIAIRESADRDIIAKRKYLARIRKKDKKAFDYYMIYERYYDYPYYYTYYGYWSALTTHQIYGWARYYLSHYRLVKGVYVYIY